MNIIAFVQARTSSKRFPNKILKKINNLTILEIIIERLKLSKNINQIVIATTDSPSDDKLIKILKKTNIKYFRGNENNVLDRFYKAAVQYRADIVVRITSDCPLLDPQIVDQVINNLIDKNVEFSSNTNPPTFPDGLDVSAFTFSTLKYAYENASTNFEKEHVTPFMIKSNVSKFCLKNHEDLSDVRWTLDEEEDYYVIKTIFNKMYPKIDFSWKEVIDINNEIKEIYEMNKKFKRNEGSMNNSGQKLWGRAKKIIPGANMLLSKRAEMFLPDHWPSYYSKTKGCSVWDLDGNKFFDLSFMGVGTNILGYSNDQVDDKVREVINNGNLSTLNSPEEVYLAERLIQIHPWSGMVKFARTGGEANAIAVRIARAYSGKDKIAVCGYHGWHDWYLAANINKNNNLEKHLLPGLDPLGVPSDLEGTTFTFEYNNYEQLLNLVENKGIGIIKMEVIRNFEPEDKFLEKVRDLATKKGIILIFDECTTGFRSVFGGIHKNYNIEPDIAIFGKAIGNGYAITAVVGKKDIMESAQSTFISSTFWTERIGPTAALATLDLMENIKSWNIINKIGRNIIKKLKDLSLKHDLPMSVFGLPSIIKFTFESENNLAYKTFVTQEMLKKGFLASNTIYVCIEHNEKILEKYFQALDEIFKTISDCENGLNIHNLLDGPVCHSGFKRLN